MTLMVPFARTDVFKFSYFVRVTHLWNLLPFSIRSIQYLEHDHTHSANQRREFSCSIFHKRSGITSISMLYIEHTNDI